MPAEIYIARHLRLSPRDAGGRRATPSVGIAVGGVALAFAVMALTVAVVCGFKKEIVAKVTGFDAQAAVVAMQGFYQPEGVRIEADDEMLANVASALPADALLAPTLSQPGILKTDDDFLGVVFRGYDRNAGQLSQLDVVDGSVPDYSAEESANSIMISAEMASKLGLAVGDRVPAFFFADGNLRARKLDVAAIYRSNFGEFDRLVGYASLPLLRKVSGAAPAEVDRIEVRGLQPDRILESVDRLQLSLNQSTYLQQNSAPLYVDNVYRIDAAYFSWLELLDMNVVVILILVGCVAGFTLVACLFIIIIERVRTIGLLKSLGATNRQIRRIFLYLSGRIVLKGLLIGNAVALLAVWLEGRYRLIPLDPESYYLSSVPVYITPVQWLVINAAVAVVALLLTFVPATVISRTSPTKTMRFE